MKYLVTYKNYQKKRKVRTINFYWQENLNHKQIQSTLEKIIVYIKSSATGFWMVSRLSKRDRPLFGSNLQHQRQWVFSRSPNWRRYNLVGNLSTVNCLEHSSTRAIKTRLKRQRGGLGKLFTVIYIIRNSPKNQESGN